MKRPSWRPRPGWERRLLGVLPVAVPVVVVLGIMVGYADRPDFPHHRAPEGFEPAPPPTTLPDDYELPSLPAVGGSTTTTPPPNVGSARLSGYVIGADGLAIPGVLVRIERSIGDGVQVVDVMTDASGHYDRPGIGGGRYRVRAFLPPTIAQRTAEVFFLRDGEALTVDLQVESFDQPSIRVATAPEPLLLDQPLNLVVRVTGRFVDPDGFVRVQPLVGGSVAVAVSGAAWERETPPGPVLTGVDGSAQLRYVCRDPAATVVQVTVQATPESVPTVAQFEVPACVDPATIPTTTVDLSTSTTDGATSTTDPGPTTSIDFP